MGLAVSLLFVILSHLSPQALVPELTPYRPMIVLMALAALFSALPLLQDGRRLIVSQSLWISILFGICILSLPAHGWLGGFTVGLMGFALAYITYFVVLLNLGSLNDIRWLGRALLFIALYYTVRAILAVDFGIDSELYSIFEWKGSELGGERLQVQRAVGAGFLNDPNDLAQALLMSLPFLWFGWKKGAPLLNVGILLVTAFILYGVFLTGSRGGLIALVAMLAMLLKRRLGLAGPVVAAGFGALLLLVFGFGGGRVIGISTGSGASRLEMWSEALGLFRSDPLRGVGFSMILDYMEMTTHNSFLLPLAELGLFGALAWIGLITVSFMQVLQIRKHLASRQELAAHYQMAEALFLAWIGFAAACWFLSRTYSPTLYVLLGATAALWNSARKESPHLEGLPAFRVTANVGLVFVAALVTAYLMVRLRWIG